MSGGHWEYSHERIRDDLTSIGLDPLMQKRFPHLAHYLADFAERVYGVIHDLDWAFSGDTIIEDDAQFEAHALRLLRETGTEG